MLDILTISWIVGLFCVAVYIINVVRLIRIIFLIKNMSEEIYKALIYMSGTFISLGVYLVAIGVFGIIKIDITNNLWIGISGIYIIMVLFWGFGTYKLFDIMRGIE